MLEFPQGYAVFWGNDDYVDLDLVNIPTIYSVHEKPPTGMSGSLYFIFHPKINWKSNSLLDLYTPPGL